HLVRVPVGAGRGRFPGIRARADAGTLLGGEDVTELAALGSELVHPVVEERPVVRRELGEWPGHQGFPTGTLVGSSTGRSGGVPAAAEVSSKGWPVSGSISPFSIASSAALRLARRPAVPTVPRPPSGVLSLVALRLVRFWGVSVRPTRRVSSWAWRRSICCWSTRMSTGASS